MKNDHRIIGIHIQDRVSLASGIQSILTEFGCNIKTRLGLHDVNENFCSPSGIILLEMTGDTADAESMILKLKKIDGVDAQQMIFSHN